jgi:hypothetical protein
MESTGWQDWFEKIWEYREGTIYTDFFGELENGIHTLSADPFLNTFGQESFDPRWLFFRNIQACPPAGYPDSFNIESGIVDLMALVGITDDEVQYARENDGEKLVELLARASAFPITDPARKSVIHT